MTTTLYALENIKTNKIVKISTSEKEIFFARNKINTLQKRNYKIVVFVRKGYVK